MSSKLGMVTAIYVSVIQKYIFSIMEVCSWLHTFLYVKSIPCSPCILIPSVLKGIKITLVIVESLKFPKSVWETPDTMIEFVEQPQA